MLYHWLFHELQRLEDRAEAGPNHAELAPVVEALAELRWIFLAVDYASGQHIKNFSEAQLHRMQDCLARWNPDRLRRAVEEKLLPLVKVSPTARSAGRPKVLFDPERILELVESGNSVTEIAKRLGCSRQSIYRRLKEMRKAPES